MCKAANRRFYDYARIGPTQAFITELSSETGIPGSVLIQSVKGGAANIQGTWVHPQVAIHLAQWLSPRFAVQVSKWVHEFVWVLHPADAADALSSAPLRAEPEKRPGRSFFGVGRNDASHHCPIGRPRLHASGADATGHFTGEDVLRISLATSSGSIPISCRPMTTTMKTAGWSGQRPTRRICYQRFGNTLDRCGSLRERKIIFDGRIPARWRTSHAFCRSGNRRQITDAMIYGGAIRQISRPCGRD